VEWFGAVQGQDWTAAASALAVRCSTPPHQPAVDSVIATNLIRIHAMRQTWHLVMPSDVRWMLDLTAPQMRRALASSLRRFELDPDTCTTAVRTFEQEIAKGPHLTRPDKISADMAVELASAWCRRRLAAGCARSKIGKLMSHLR